MSLDEKDLKIIRELKRNSREPIRGVAKKTGLRPSTVHQRLVQLVRNKVIQGFTVKLDSKALNENFVVFMLVKGGTSNYIQQSVLGDSHVREVFGITGEYDLLLKMRFKDVEEFNNFIISFRKGQKGIEQTLTMVATVNLKEEL
ncbi:MAG TPA: Lrp/AsnC family transcriptional regulator [Candidatus Nanoarchaeia archaeon]|nr:Lrp/AsnC family transcriptional regulator [Candidatus Nanoarchaeia archaeon]